MPTSPDSQAVLEVRDVVKTFPGVRALDDVCFELRKGEVHALVGENGAGKSTLMHVLGGVFPREGGEILLDGRPFNPADPHVAAGKGVCVVFQELSLSPNLSIAENIFAHRQPLRWKWPDLIDRKLLHERTSDILQRFELQLDPATPVRDLPVALRQVVEILKAISQKPQILILDEPTSSLTAVETVRLFENIRQLKAHETSVIYISHHLPEIFEIADRVTVLRDGRDVETCDVADVTEDEVVRKMVGRELIDMYGRRETPVGSECFRIEGGRRGEAFSDVSFAVHSGEIVGMAGLAGAGRTELARAIFGAEPLDAGRLYVNEKPVTVRSPRQAIANRIGYLTEERKAHGLFMRMSIRQNCVAPVLSCLADRWGLMNDSAITALADRSRAEFGIVTPSIHQEVGNLSGGNQQKVLLAMWITAGPLFLIADEPTRGVDVGAKSEIYRRLRALAAGGVGILLISSELPEVLGLSDRILVMRAGRLAGRFEADQATEEKLIACATGLGAAAGNGT
ncbi:MAG: sugar ABC transporter ATP-binding protein [Phycisphaerae bacterium]|jgi:ABC-type sugar transport system ATPase subunit|nr:sugar ABC transporter ATP-binding protein [Phycisphaerae bacterium]